MDTLESWLSRLTAVHPEHMEFGLDRVRAVWQSMGAKRPAPLLVTVGGTNGKGSTVAFLCAMLHAAGYRVGAYTSPHLYRFNERIVIDGIEATDTEITSAFERVDAARAGVSLTFFEYATLAAIDLFAASTIDVAVFEVGLGGRLDAVNLLDADVAIVTTVDLDHQAHLGDVREKIAIEKAGIFRAGRPAVIGEIDPPATLMQELERIGALPWRLGHEYRIDIDADDWRWIGAGTSLRLPHPELRAQVQHFNAAAAIAALMALRDRVHVPFRALRVGLAQARLRGRLEIFPAAVETVVDVGHNPQAARVLADWMRRNPRRTRAVFSALSDKDIAGIVEPLLPRVSHWHLTGLADVSSRGLSAQALRERTRDLIDDAACSVHSDATAALESALAEAAVGERVLVFGSFYLVSVLGPALNRIAVPAN